MSSFWMPNKKPLYAPMIASFGGGSGRGFGRGRGLDIIKTLYEISNFTFTDAGAMGNLGPTYSMAQNAYSTAPFINDPVLYSVEGEGIQRWVVPKTGTWRITAKGAYGGPGEVIQSQHVSDAGGRPRQITADFDLNAGDVLGIVVGQPGGHKAQSWSSSVAGGGGGGTFIFKINVSRYDSGENIFSVSCDPLLIAAGGNGANWDNWSSPTVNAAGIDTGTTNTIPQIPDLNGKIGGRASYGASWLYTPYHEQNASSWGHFPHDSFEDNKFWRYPRPALGTDGFLNTDSFVGGITFDNSITSSNFTTYRTRTSNFSNTEGLMGSNGGFGGGGGTRYEGGGGGGYWGGVAANTNQYVDDFNSYSGTSFGAWSYVQPGAFVSQNIIHTVATLLERTSHYGNSYPPSSLRGFAQFNLL